MELLLLAIAAIGVMMSIYGKYAYERARGRLGENVGFPCSHEPREAQSSTLQDRYFND